MLRKELSAYSQEAYVGNGGINERAVENIVICSGSAVLFTALRNFSYTHSPTSSLFQLHT
jgi:hypothetical protein